MRRFMLLTAMCGALVLTATTIALAQTVQTAPQNPDGSCPEGFVQVNAPFCAQESPNTPGRVFGFGEGDLTGQYAQPETQSDSSFVPCPLGLDQYPAGTACGEGGSYILPNGLPAQGTLSEGGGEQIAEPQATAPTQATTEALPATGGPSPILLAGALLVGAGLVLRRR